MIKGYPHWDKRYPTFREFKRIKRKQAAAVEHALWDLVSGCAYTPISDIGVMQQKVREWRDALSVKKWGR